MRRALLPRGKDVGLETEPIMADYNVSSAGVESPSVRRPLPATFSDAIDAIGMGPFQHLLMLICGMVGAFAVVAICRGALEWGSLSVMHSTPKRNVHGAQSTLDWVLRCIAVLVVFWARGGRPGAQRRPTTPPLLLRLLVRVAPHCCCGATGNIPTDILLAKRRSTDVPTTSRPNPQTARCVIALCSADFASVARPRPPVLPMWCLIVLSNCKGWAIDGIEVLVIAFVLDDIAITFDLDSVSKGLVGSASFFGEHEEHDREVQQQ